MLNSHWCASTGMSGEIITRQRPVDPTLLYSAALWGSTIPAACRSASWLLYPLTTGKRSLSGQMQLQKSLAYRSSSQTCQQALLHPIVWLWTPQFWFAASDLWVTFLFPIRKHPPWPSHPHSSTISKSHPWESEWLPRGQLATAPTQEADVLAHSTGRNRFRKRWSDSMLLRCQRPYKFPGFSALPFPPLDSTR